MVIWLRRTFSQQLHQRHRKNTFKKITKKRVFMVMTIQNKIMIKKLFKKLCCKSFELIYPLVFYRKTRRSLVNYMLRRFMQVRSVISFMPHALLHECTKYEINSSFQLTKSLAKVAVDPVIWRKIEATHSIFNLICQGIAELSYHTA